MENSSFTTDANPDVQTVTLQSEASPISSPLKVSKRWTIILATTLILFIGTVGTILLRLQNASRRESAKSQPIKSQNIELSNLSEPATPFEIDANNRVLINGQLQASQSILLIPGDQPTTNTTGQIYVDKTTNEVRYYNGTDYLTFATTTSLGDLQQTLNLVKN